MKISKTVITRETKYIELTQKEEFYLKITEAKKQILWHRKSPDEMPSEDDNRYCTVDSSTKLNQEQLDFIESIRYVVKGDKIVLTNDYNLGHGTLNSEEKKAMTEGNVYTVTKNEEEGQVGAIVTVLNDNGRPVRVLKRRFTTIKESFTN